MKERPLSPHLSVYKPIPTMVLSILHRITGAALYFGTLLVAWSLSGLVIPAITTALTPVFGPRVFMYIAIVIAAAYFVFVVVRMRMSDPVPEEETVDHQTVSAQAPLTAELSPPTPVGIQQREFQETGESS